jgi:hypothetical protein
MSWRRPPRNGAGFYYRRQLAHYYNLLIPADASGARDRLRLRRTPGRRSRPAAKSASISPPASSPPPASRVPGAEFHVQAGEALKLAEPVRLHHHFRHAESQAADVQQLSSNCTASRTPTRAWFFNYFHNSGARLLTFATWLGLKLASAPEQLDQHSGRAQLPAPRRLADRHPVGRILLPVPCLRPRSPGQPLAGPAAAVVLPHGLSSRPAHFRIRPRPAAPSPSSSPPATRPATSRPPSPAPPTWAAAPS